MRFSDNAVEGVVQLAEASPHQLRGHGWEGKQGSASPPPETQAPELFVSGRRERGELPPSWKSQRSALTSPCWPEDTGGFQQRCGRRECCRVLLQRSSQESGTPPGGADSETSHGRKKICSSGRAASVRDWPTLVEGVGTEVRICQMRGTAQVLVTHQAMVIGRCPRQVRPIWTTTSQRIGDLTEPAMHTAGFQNTFCTHPQLSCLSPCSLCGTGPISVAR
jgi:hypothetical protein